MTYWKMKSFARAFHWYYGFYNRWNYNIFTMKTKLNVDFSTRLARAFVLDAENVSFPLLFLFPWIWAICILHVTLLHAYHCFAFWYPQEKFVHVANFGCCSCESVCMYTECCVVGTGSWHGAVVSFHDVSTAAVANNSLISHSTDGSKTQTRGQGTLTNLTVNSDTQWPILGDCWCVMTNYSIRWYTTLDYIESC